LQNFGRAAQGGDGFLRKIGATVRRSMKQRAVPNRTGNLNVNRVGSRINTFMLQMVAFPLLWNLLGKRK
jgi:hypothetical protein